MLSASSSAKSAKVSQFPLFTVHDDPKDAVVASHRLLVRGGFIQKQASGFYIYLPLALIIHRKIEDIIRNELNKAGAVEVRLPVLTPGEFWQTSQRWDSMGREMMRLQDRHLNHFVLGPTHEEAMSSLAANYLQSYKQLPVNFYQIGTKYRDEIRPRYGLIRCREFVMKDAYSFHADDESLDETYRKMSVAYRNIFAACGLEAISVEADTGAMGGSASEEFMIASEIGEETLLLCEDPENGYRSNQEKTEFIPFTPYPVETSQEAASQVETPDVRTVEEVAAFLKKEPSFFVKTLIHENDHAVVVSFIPGDREINEIKLANSSGQIGLEMASPETIRAVTGAEPGFAGPVNLNESPLPAGNGQSEKKVIVLFDRTLKGRGNLVSGANRTGYHTTGLQEGRDFNLTGENGVDLVLAQEGDATPGAPDKKLIARKGIEVGHIFKLGKKYAHAFQISVLDPNGKTMTPTMGTYGIGVGRTLAAAVEQNHDERGIIWPENLAPFQYHLIGLYKNEEQKGKIDALYNELCEAGLSIYYDDRKESPGVKFNDADLLGMPWQIIAGRNFMEKGVLEMKNRRTGEKSEVSLADLEKADLKKA